MKREKKIYKRTQLKLQKEKKYLKPSWLHRHKWSRWQFIGQDECEYGYMLDILTRKCLTCGMKEKYKGLSETDIITNEKTPYIYKT